MAPPRGNQLHLHHNIEKCEWCRPHERYELCGGGSDKGSSQPDGGMHPWHFRLEAKWQIWGREGEGIGINGCLDLFHRRLYDADEGFQLCQGILRSASVARECIVKPLNIDNTWGLGTHLAGSGNASDVFKDEGVGS